MKLVGTNIAFSHDGLAAVSYECLVMSGNLVDLPTQLHITDDLQDPSFTDGQLKGAISVLSDPAVPGSTTDPAWEPAFKTTIHGCFNVTGESRLSINERISQLDTILESAVKTVSRVDGAVRRGNEKGREHFGFQDGLSQPAVTGFRLPNAGEAATGMFMPLLSVGSALLTININYIVSEAGVILLGQPGDDLAKSRPTWAIDSSFVVFRKLRQHVPEFNDFVANHPIKDPGLGHEQGSDLLGARMVGRWKSGAPIDRDPTEDNLHDARDANKVNDFDYVTGSNLKAPQLKCPFTAHLRSESLVGVFWGYLLTRLLQR